MRKFEQQTREIRTTRNNDNRTTSCVSDWFEFCLRSKERVGVRDHGKKKSSNGNEMGALLYPVALTGAAAV